MLRRTWKFTSGHKDAWLVGYLSFGGAYAALLSKLGLGRSMTVCYEPHSRYMVEMGIWVNGGSRHRIVKALERLQLRTAKALVIPTRAGVALAAAEGAECEVVLQGITIDVKAAAHDPTARAAYRTEKGLREEVVLAYVGKFGGIYYSVGDYLLFAERLLERDQGLRFLVIASVAQLDGMRAHERFARVSERFILQPAVAPEHLHEVLSAADLGVIAVPPTPAQAFRTPVKTAHYWAAGLPVIIPEGVSDDHGIAAEEKVGIVVKGLPDVDLDRFFDDLTKLNAIDADGTRERCMKAGLKHRDTEMMVAHLQRLLA
jgi:hypothetical protein